MKWLLVSTQSRCKEARGSNPGDEFAKLGIKKLIASVDGDARFEHFDKEEPERWDRDKAPRRDRTVICGMPLFWSVGGKTNLDVWWWDYMWNGWMTSQPWTVLALGVGHVLVGDVEAPEPYKKGMAQVVRRSWRVVVREPVALAPPSFVQSICPSAWCFLDRPTTRELRLCNLMRGGGHFGYVRDKGKVWDRDKAKPVSNFLKGAGFTFVAHDRFELAYAAELGWPSSRVVLFDSAQEYLDLYARAAIFFGNRMHGAAVCAAAGCPTWGATHDSRAGMVRRLGGIGTTCEEVTLEKLRGFVEYPPTATGPAPEFEPAVQFRRMQDLLRTFMRQ